MRTAINREPNEMAPLATRAVDCDASGSLATTNPSTATTCELVALLEKLRDNLGSCYGDVMAEAFAKRCRQPTSPRRA